MFSAIIESLTTPFCQVTILQGVIAYSTIMVAITAILLVLAVGRGVYDTFSTPKKRR